MSVMVIVRYFLKQQRYVFHLNSKVIINDSKVILCFSAGDGFMSVLRGCDEIFLWQLHIALKILITGRPHGLQ